MAAIIESERYNRAQTVGRAAVKVIKLAYDIDMSSELSAQLAKTAAKLQAEHVRKRGGGVMTATINIRRFHLHVLARQQRLGEDWGTKIPMLELRQTCTTAARLMFVSRPEDLPNFLKGIERFEPSGADWRTASAVSVRFLDTKDTKSNKMNAHVRAPEDMQQGNLCSVTRVERPRPPKGWLLPDYFMYFYWYTRRRGERDTPLVSVTVSRDGKSETLSPPRLFVGEGIYKDRDVTRSTLSSEIKRGLCQCAAISDGSKLEAEHLRHSALSQVYNFAPDRMREALLRARHDKETFLRHYYFALPSEQEEEMERYLLAVAPANEIQIELLLLG